MKIEARIMPVPKLPTIDGVPLDRVMHELRNALHAAFYGDPLWLAPR